MRKSHDLEKLCAELFEALPNWDKIIDRFKSHPQFDPNNSFTLPEYAKYFSEIHLDLCLEELSERYPEYNISLTPIKERDESNNYGFHYSIAGRLFAYSKKDKTHFEYDEVILVGKLPVVFEIKLTKWKQPRIHREKLRNGGIQYRPGRGVMNSLRPEVYNRKLKPICEFFGCDVGYVMVIPKKMYWKREQFLSEESIYNQFKNKNGIIIPFYIDKDIFRKEVLQNIIKYKLKLRVGR